MLLGKSNELFCMLCLKEGIFRGQLHFNIIIANMAAVFGIDEIAVKLGGSSA